MPEMTPYEQRLLRKRAVANNDIVQEPKEFTQQDWNRRGFKKLEKTVVSGKFKNCEVTIYFDRSDGMFGATLNGITSMTRDYQSLVRALCESVRTSESVTFTRFIEVSYERNRGTRVTSLHGRAYGGFDSENRPVVGLRLDFHVYDVSELFDMTYADGRGKARVWRLIEPPLKSNRGQSKALKFTDDGWWIKLEDTVNEDHRDDGKLIPYTEERYRVLHEIQDGIRAIDARLQTIFGDKVSSKKQAAQLDVFSGTKLLPAPPTAKGKKRR